MMRFFPGLLAGLVLGLFMISLLRWAFPAEPEVRYERVEVPVTVIERAEPDTVVRWRERIVTRIVAPDTVLIAPGAGAGDVGRFCPPLTPSTPGTGPPEPVEATPRALLLRSVSYRGGSLLRAGEAVLTGPTSDMDLIQYRVRVRDSWSARVSGDSVIVRTPRFAVVKESGEALLWMGAGAGIICLLKGC